MNCCTLYAEGGREFALRTEAWWSSLAVLTHFLTGWLSRAVTGSG